MGILIYQIPFIHKQDQSFPLFNDIIQNGFVLFAEPFFPINQHQRHITMFNGSLGTKGTVKFNQKKLLEIALGLGFIKTGIRSKDGKPVGYEMEKILGK